MKKAFVFSLLATLAITGCQAELEELIPENNEQEVITQEPAKVFTAIVDDDFSGDTKTSLDGSGNVLWKQYDQVSIFAASTVNEQYQVSDDSDGKTAATLNKIPAGGFVAGTDIDNNVAFYPYASTASIAKSGSNYVISDVELPATQTYVAGSFGNGAFPMAAVTSSTEDMNLKFKNVLGGLKLQLKGTATITSITVTGNNDEILYGDAEVTMAYGGVPSISLSDATAKTVTLDCGAGVTLDSETATPFIIALPPMTMTGGFTVVVSDSESKQMEIKTTKSQTIPRSNLLKMPAVTYVGSVPESPLKFASTGSTSISLTKSGTPDAITLEYKLDSGEWTSYTVGNAIDLTDGQEVSFRAGASGNSSFSQSYSNYYQFVFSGSGTVAASGNIMSLLNREGGLTIPTSYCFAGLFEGCTSLTTAPTLPATTLAKYCYLHLFDGCSGLIAAPELPATTLADGCYSCMFAYSGLTTAPELPATTLAENCYSNMFEECTSLTTPPTLPATTLAKFCYSAMFVNCYGLTTAPELPATSLASSCYDSMFTNCKGLTTAPELPATTLDTYCYSNMFASSGLTTAPELPATTLALDCYSGMFKGCSSLASAPELPATTLASNCYNSMFYACTGLTSTPELPATTLASSCYTRMFYQCTKLTTAPALPATTLANDCYYEMFYYCTRLTSAPELPATSLEKECYSGMFNQCVKLTTAPELPATTLANDCYSSMFYGCTGLTSAPELPATTLKQSCYYRMFYGCTGLTAAPELSATTLAIRCYSGMFVNCSKLNYIKMLATNISASNCLSGWVTGVAATGTFVKNSSATWDVTGTSGVPSGWTIETE